MKKNILLPFFLVFLSLLAISPITFGQTIIDNKTDSLQQIIDKKTGTDKISSQLELALIIITSDINEAQILANSALTTAKNIGNKNLQMQSYFMLGRIYTEQENHKLSLTYLDSALKITETTNDNWYKAEILFRIGVDKHRMGEEIQALESFNASILACRLSDNFKITGSSYSMMGTIFRMNGLYDRAIEYIIKSKLNYEKAGYTEGSAWAAYLIGRIYADLKLPEQALEYFQESLEMYIKFASIDGNQNGLAICYEQMGILNLEQGNFEKARKYIDNTLKIYSADESKYGMSNVLKNLGKIEYFTGNYTLAIKYLEESLQIKKEVNDMLSRPDIHEYLGLCLIKIGQTEKGFSQLRQGLEFAISNNQKKIQLDIYSKLTEAYLYINDLGNAIDCQNKQIEIQNLILSGAANIKTEQLQAIYEIDEKNNQIAELEKQNKINELSIKQHQIIQNIMIFGIILAVFILTIVFWFYRKIRQKNNELNEINAAKDKFFTIIAHDLRGPTSALASLLDHLNSRFDEFKKAELKEILSTLYKSAENVSNLLENLLIWAQSQVSKIECRPTELKLNQVIESAVKGLNQTAENKQIGIKIENNDPLIVFADPDMVQTIIRNILSNAIKYSRRGGSVNVKTALAGKTTAQISITDNGVGIEKSKLANIFEITNTYHTQGTENEKSTGLGLILVKDFVKKNKGTIKIESEKNKGTTVSFTLPIASISSAEINS